MEIKTVKLLQYDRNLKKIAEYDKDRDEGVWLRYIIELDLTNIHFSFELQEGKKVLTALQDLDVSILDDVNEKRQDIIKMFHQEVVNAFKHIREVYKTTDEDEINFLKANERSGEDIYNALKLFYENLDEETKEDIKAKNVVKETIEEICLNDIKELKN